MERELAKATGEDHSADPHESCADEAREVRLRAERAELKLKEERESHHRQMGGLRAKYDDTVETSRIRADRIRELEAELAYLRRTTDRGILKAFDELKAHTEKAEDELKMATSRWAILRSEYVARIEELEGRTELEKALGDFRSAMLAKFEARAFKHPDTVTVDGNLARLDQREIDIHLRAEIEERLAATSENRRDEDIDVANLCFLDWYKARERTV